MSRFSILVVWDNGTQEWLMEGSRIASFTSRTRAERWRDFMLMGVEDEVQSINVVPSPPQLTSPKPKYNGISVPNRVHLPD